MKVFFSELDGVGALFFTNGEKKIGNFENGGLIEQFSSAFKGMCY